MKNNKIMLMVMVSVMAYLICLYGKVSQAADSTVPGGFATIQAAIDDAGTVAGNTITLTAANHVESNIHVTKAVTIAGAVGSSLDPGAGQIGIFPDADNVTIRDLTIQDCSQAIRIYKPAGTVDSTTLLRVIMLNCASRGIELHNDTTVTNLLVDDCTFDQTVTGFRVSSSGHIDGAEFRDSTFIRLNIGIYEANDGGTSTMKDVLVTGCTFEDISRTWGSSGYAIFVEELQDAVIDDNTFTNNYRDIEIFKWYQASVEVSNVNITNNTMTGTINAVFAIFNAEHSSGQTVFNGVSFTNNTATNIGQRAVYASAHDDDAGLGGLGWDTVHINCNSFLDIPGDEGVFFYVPGALDPNQALGGASIDVTKNWWGTTDASAVAALMNNPAITDFEPFLSDVPGDQCLSACDCDDPDAITGGPGFDILFGTPGDDIICGNGGKDIIFGLGGNDCIDGGDGRDLIFGCRGDDTIFGREGKDTILGGSGNDTINGGDGNDKIFAGSGDDTIDGGDGHDKIFGGRGDDTIDGGDGYDKIFGGRGTDECVNGEFVRGCEE